MGAANQYWVTVTYRASGDTHKYVSFQARNRSDALNILHKYRRNPDSIIEAKITERNRNKIRDIVTFKGHIFDDPIPF